MLDSLRVLTSPGRYLSKMYNIPFIIYSAIPFFYFNRISRSYPIVKDFFIALRTSTPLPVGAAGFCWGGKHAVLLAGDPTQIISPDGSGKPLIDAAFTGHPSLLDLSTDIEAMVRPVSFAVGDGDPQISVVQANQIRGIVEAKPADQRGEVVIYEGCGHGFCVRADVSFAEVSKQAAKAEDQCLRWFDRWLLGRK